MADSSSSQLHDLANCLSDWRLTSSIAVASSALLFYDYTPGAHAQNVIGAEKGGPFSSHQGGPINSSKSVPTTHSPSSNTGSSGSGSGSGVGMGRMKSAPVQAESPIQGLPMPPASPTSITRPTAAMRKTSSHKRMAIGKNKSDRHERLESEDEA